MSCISDEGLVVISDSRICNLELGTSVGEEDYLWAMAPIVELEFACRGIGINVELGEEWKSFVGYVTVLVSFDVLDSGAYWLEDRGERVEFHSEHPSLGQGLRMETYCWIALRGPRRGSIRHRAGRRWDKEIGRQGLC